MIDVYNNKKEQIKELFQRGEHNFIIFWGKLWTEQTWIDVDITDSGGTIRLQQLVYDIVQAENIMIQENYFMSVKEAQQGFQEIYTLVFIIVYMWSYHKFKYVE
jgi:hypothetical protein